MVGAGIVGLTTAYMLTRAGSTVTVLDANPGPGSVEAETKVRGASWSGLGARMYTQTEADVYDEFLGNGTSNNLSEMPLMKGGIDLRAARNSADGSEGKNVALDSASIRRSRIFALTRQARPIWDELLLELQSNRDLRRHDEILRLYSTEKAFEGAVDRHGRIGDLREVVGKKQLRQQCSALAHCPVDEIFGGIWVDGFTIDVHSVMSAMIDAISAGGGEVCFNSDVLAVNSGGASSRHALEVRLRDGRTYGCEEVVLATGAFGNRLSESLGFKQLAHGMIGVWLSLPNVYGWNHSLKLRRPGALCEDANVTIGEYKGVPSLLVGSGYGYTGIDPDNFDEYQLHVMLEDVRDMCRRIFPLASSYANFDQQMKSPIFCVRPWTRNSVPVQASQDIGNGRVHLVTGHNTGGFAMAPVVAEQLLGQLVSVPRIEERLVV